jgi:hypothetical protein
MEELDKETAFAELVRDYENQWVALDESEGVKVIVGYGRTAIEAVAAAEKNGHPDAALFKVPSFRSTFVPSVTLFPSAH